ncbi:hypothetical protein [Halorhabdus rudnickae]|uniref:hypothetical protein n=1 Tax=Halorhabdus rudnickae TaxID=1775544 RepID=UPI001082AD2F|nr:hypothetical protein [Halorhabdus rudnickae]
MGERSRARRGEQRYSAFDEAVKEATDAVVAKYTDGEDADVDGIEGYVVEGRVLERELLRDTVEMVVGMIEEESEFDRHTPGPIVEPAEEETNT